MQYGGLNFSVFCHYQEFVLNIKRKWKRLVEKKHFSAAANAIYQPFWLSQEENIHHLFPQLHPSALKVCFEAEYQGKFAGRGS